MLFETLVLEDRSALTLLNADFTFMNERLAKHYGVPAYMATRCVGSP